MAPGPCGNLLVTDIVSGGPADGILKIDDMIVKIGGITVAATNVNDAHKLMRDASRVGKVVVSVTQPTSPPRGK